MELFKGKPCVQFVTPFLCPERNKIRLNDRTHKVTFPRHLLDLHNNAVFFISSYPFSQLLKPGSWRKTSPFHFYFFFHLSALLRVFNFYPTHEAQEKRIPSARWGASCDTQKVKHVSPLKVQDFARHHSSPKDALHLPHPWPAKCKSRKFTISATHFARPQDNRKTWKALKFIFPFCLTVNFLITCCL